MGGLVLEVRGSEGCDRGGVGFSVTGVVGLIIWGEEHARGNVGFEFWREAVRFDISMRASRIEESKRAGPAPTPALCFGFLKNPTCDLILLWLIFDSSRG